MCRDRCTRAGLEKKRCSLKELMFGIKSSTKKESLCLGDIYVLCLYIDDGSFKTYKRGHFCRLRC